MSTETPQRTRRPRARQRDIIFGAIDERLAMLTDELHNGSSIVLHAERLRELIEELKRSIGGKDDE